MLAAIYRLLVSVVIHQLRWVTYQDLPSDPVSCWRKEECGSMSDIGYLVSIVAVTGLTLIPHSGKRDLRNH